MSGSDSSSLPDCHSIGLSESPEPLEFGPEVLAPSIPRFKLARTPGLRTPGLRTPGLRTPGLRTPGLRTPGLRTPGRRAFLENAFRESSQGFASAALRRTKPPGWDTCLRAQQMPRPEPMVLQAGIAVAGGCQLLSQSIQSCRRAKPPSEKCRETQQAQFASVVPGWIV